MLIVQKLSIFLTVTDLYVKTKVTVKLDYHCPHAKGMVSFPQTLMNVTVTPVKTMGHVKTI